MNKDKIKGSWKVVKGKAKEEAGHATGNTSIETEGITDQIIGKLQKKMGTARDAVKKVIDSALNR